MLIFIARNLKNGKYKTKKNLNIIIATFMFILCCIVQNLCDSIIDKYSFLHDIELTYSLGYYLFTAGNFCFTSLILTWTIFIKLSLKKKIEI